MPLKAVLLSLALAATGASAQTVWRCGSSYGTQPCAGGSAVDVTDRSTSPDAAQATRRAAEDMRRAEAMEKARLAADRNAPKAIVIGPNDPPPPAKEHAKPQKGKKKNEKEGGTKPPEAFIAAVPKKK